VAETVYSREKFLDGLKRVTVVARGPKPVAVLKELGVPVAVTVPEPNTWRDLLEVIDKNGVQLQVKGVAVQEYGESNPELLAGLAERGAKVMQVPVYKWDLPEDQEPLRKAVHSVVAGEIDLVLFTTSVQVIHFLRVAKEMNVEKQLREALTRARVGSIGPVTSEELHAQGIHVDFEPEHPKMGYLVNEAARQMSAKKEKSR